MAFRNTTERYGSLSIGLHWMMLLLLVGVYTCVNLHEFFPKGSDLRKLLMTWHFMLGLSVLVLVFLRLAIQIGSVIPRIAPEPPQWQNLSAGLMHVALYALMIGLPLSGWLILSAAGKTIPFFGLELPALISESKSLAKPIKEIHETVGTLGYFLVGLHAAAALVHHYLIKDNTLRRMLPLHKRG